MFQTDVVKKMKTHNLWYVFFFYENCAICEIMWKKYGRAGQDTDGNIQGDLKVSVHLMITIQKTIPTHLMI